MFKIFGQIFMKLQGKLIALKFAGGKQTYFLFILIEIVEGINHSTLSCQTRPVDVIYM